jgi:hypothetical protein
VARALSRLGENVEVDPGGTCNWAVADSTIVRYGSFVDVKIKL